MQHMPNFAKDILQIDIASVVSLLIK